LTFEQMLAVATEIGEPTMRASALLNLGIVCRGLKNAQSAFDHLEDAARLSAAIGHVSLEATALGQLGLTHFQQGNLVRGIELGEAAVALALRSGDQMNTDRLSGILVANLLLMGEFARASALLYGRQRTDSPSGESALSLMRQCRLELALAAPFVAVRDRGALTRAIDAANRLKAPSNLQSWDPDLELLLSDVDAARSANEDGKPALLFRGGSPLILGATLRAALVKHLKSGDGSAWAELQRTNPALASAMESPDQPV
jgi:tetratricopeptide (TPR) repeat protein